MKHVAEAALRRHLQPQGKEEKRAGRELRLQKQLRLWLDPRLICQRLDKAENSDVEERDLMDDSLPVVVL